MEGEAVWKRIGNAIEELLSEERPDGAAVHSGSDGTRTTMGAPVTGSAAWPPTAACQRRGGGLPWDQENAAAALMVSCPSSPKRS